MKRSLTLIGVVLPMAGWYAPWVTTTRQLAALTFNALDLAEFSKFTVRAGLGHVTREWFLVPPVASALLLALWANQSPRVWRYALSLLAVLFSLVPLPPYPYLFRAYSSAEDRLSFWLCVAGAIGVGLVFVLGRRIEERWRDFVFVVLALIGSLPAAWELISHVLPTLAKLYASPALLACGFFVAMTGFTLALVGAVMRET